ncbi:MAG: GIY-YIG nuclease family protein [Hyphomonadaceae bacterium]
MVDKARKKELLRAYAERKPQTGVFAVKCASTGESWVGWSKSLDKRQNGLWFELRMGKSPEAGILAAWKAHGEDALSYEILEVVEEDDPFALQRKLDERTQHWRAELGAGVVSSR